MFVVYVGFTHGWWWAGTKLFFKSTRRSVLWLHEVSKKPEKAASGSTNRPTKRRQPKAVPLTSQATGDSGHVAFNMRANPVYGHEGESEGEDEAEEGASDLEREQSISVLKAQIKASKAAKARQGAEEV